MLFNKNVLSFEDWLANNPDIAADSQMVGCSDCEGEGEIECEECGHWRVCETCDGKGKVSSARQLYEETVSRDWGKLSAHQLDGKLYALPAAAEQKGK